MKKSIFQRFLVWLLPVALILFFICACEDSPSSSQTQISPEEISELIEEGGRDDRIGRRGRGGRSGGGSSSGGSSSGSDNGDDDDDDDDDDDNNVPFELSRLGQISGLMAQGKYEEAAELSAGPFPELSRLIENGDYDGASAYLLRMISYLGRR